MSEDEGKHWEAYKRATDDLSSLYEQISLIFLGTNINGRADHRQSGYQRFSPALVDMREEAAEEVSRLDDGGIEIEPRPGEPGQWRTVVSGLLDVFRRGANRVSPSYGGTPHNLSCSGFVGPTGRLWRDGGRYEPPPGRSSNDCFCEPVGVDLLRREDGRADPADALIEWRSAHRQSSGVEVGNWSVTC